MENPFDTKKIFLGKVKYLVDENMPEEVMNDLIDNSCPITGIYMPDNSEVDDE